MTLDRQPRSSSNGDLAKVAVFMQDFAGGGAERVMLSLASGIHEFGHDVDIVVFRKEGPYLTEVPAGINVVDLNAGFVKCLPGLVRYLKEARPAALLCALNQPNVMACWAKRVARVPVRTVLTIHSTLSMESKNGKSLRLKMMPAFVRAFYPWADAIVPVSTGVGDDLKRMVNVDPGRVHVIYNPVVSESLQSKASAPLEHPWFARGEPPVVVSAGRLTAPKDFATLIDAFAIVRSKMPARLLILGEGDDRAMLEKKVADLGLTESVSMPGFTANPYAYMSRCGVFVLSSRHEGLPTVLIEALACGARVVSSDCISGPREILADGKYGRLAPVGDVDAMAEAIVSTLLDAKGPAPDESWRPYEWKTVVEQYRHILGIG